MSESTITKDNLILGIIVITLIMSISTLYIVVTSLAGSSEKMDSQSEIILALSKSMESMSASTSEMAEILGAIPPDFFEPTEVLETIRIGMPMMLTGKYAYLGWTEIHGAEIAVDKVNSEGGLLMPEGRRRVELIVYDTKGIAAEAVAVSKKLIEKDKIHVLTGGWLSSNIMPMMAIAEEKEIPYVLDDGSNYKITMPKELGGTFNEWCFHPYSTDLMMAKAEIDGIMNLYNPSKVAFLAVNDEWGSGSILAFKPRYEERGVEVVYEGLFMDGEKEFYPYLLKIKELGADLISLSSPLPAYTLILQQYRELGLDQLIPIYSDVGISTEHFEVIGRDLIGLWDTAKYSPEYQSPENVYFVEQVQARFGVLPDLGYAFGYHTLNIAFEAIERAGTTDPYAIRDALEETQYLGLWGLISFDEYHQASTPIMFRQVQEIDGILTGVITESPTFPETIDWTVEKPPT